VEMLNNQIARNDIQSFVELGEFEWERENYEKAFELFAQAVDLGSIRGHSCLGAWYYDGMGTTKDRKKAAHHWEIAAMNGDSRARHSLGRYEIYCQRK
jgi:TPR repeat protein